MKIGKFDTTDTVLIIAEIGNNHEGNPNLAAELIGRAAEAGANAVKFQTYNTEAFISRNDIARFNRMKKYELSEEIFTSLSRQAKDLGLVFISTPFDLQSVRFLEGIVDAIKIASGDNTFPQLISGGAETGKPMIMSTGIAEENEIKSAVAAIKSAQNRIGAEVDLALLHCVSSYPTEAAHANLAAINTLAETFPECVIGYSDHTIGIDVAVAAVTANARIIEKHFTIDNNYSDFRDHRLSANPQTLREMVDKIKEVSNWMGNGLITLADCERDGEPSFRRSAHAACNLKAGDVVKDDDIIWLRPGGGIPPDKSSLAVGHRVNTNIKAGQMIDLDKLD